MSRFIYCFPECHYAECRVLYNVLMNVNMLGVVMLSRYAECRYAECRYDECRGACQLPINLLPIIIIISFVKFLKSSSCRMECAYFQNLAL